MTVESKEQLFELLRQHEAQLRRFGVRSCGLFGSFARGEQGGGSDVDLPVEFEPGRKSFDNFMGLAFFLEEVLGRRVDLVTPESLSPHTGPLILREVEYAATAA